MAVGRVDDLTAGFDALKERISRQTSAEGREWEKVAVLFESVEYGDFLSRLTGGEVGLVHRTLVEFTEDEAFREAFGKNLRQFESSERLVHGDVRFHSLTLYVVARLTRPSVIVETGVASGKSSALLLLALEHNGLGRMVSIDLPNSPGAALADGACTHTGDFPVGWLVPDHLRHRWDLRLGDAAVLLPQVVEQVGEVDLFFHDSLHTYDHVLFELTTVAPRLRPPATILVDNVDVAQGAFERFVEDRRLEGVLFGDMGGTRVSERQF